VGRQLVVALLVVGLGTLVLAGSRLPETCPLSWDGAERITKPERDNAYIRVDAYHLYGVGGQALLDYMPTVESGPLRRLGPVPHPLVVTLGISAGTRGDLESAEFTCVRVTHGGETWSRRPQNYGIESPQWDLPGPSGRLAAAGSGPEWPAGDEIRMEAWLAIGTRHYIVEFPPFVLMKGG
jgi:hypothetical protein